MNIEGSKFCQCGHPDYDHDEMLLAGHIVNGKGYCYWDDCECLYFEEVLHNDELRCADCGHLKFEHDGSCSVVVDQGCGDDGHCPRVWCYCTEFCDTLE